MNIYSIYNFWKDNPILVKSPMYKHRMCLKSLFLKTGKYMTFCFWGELEVASVHAMLT